MRRTKCACKLCQHGCKTMPGYLIPSDLRHFKEVDLAASEGAVIKFLGIERELPTVVPRQKSNGHCIFYRKGKCAVHQCAPYGCRAFSACEPETAATEVARIEGVISLIESHDNEDRYHDLSTELLPKAALRKERQAAYRRAFDEH